MVQGLGHEVVQARCLCIAYWDRQGLYRCLQGCFWGVEHYFNKEFEGAIKASAVGYTGGEAETPNYRQVCPVANSMNPGPSPTNQASLQHALAAVVKQCYICLSSMELSVDQAFPVLRWRDSAEVWHRRCPV